MSRHTGYSPAMCVQQLIKNVKKEFSGYGVLQDSIHMLARASTVTEAASILDNIYPKCLPAI
jgi:hypothetical protein